MAKAGFQQVQLRRVSAKLALGALDRQQGKRRRIGEAAVLPPAELERQGSVANFGIEGNQRLRVEDVCDTVDPLRNLCGFQCGRSDDGDLRGGLLCPRFPWSWRGGLTGAEKRGGDNANPTQHFFRPMCPAHMHMENMCSGEEPGMFPIIFGKNAPTVCHVPVN
jgi:hypothetical protein